MKTQDRDGLRERTTLSKFLVAQGLASRGATFVFWEVRWDVMRPRARKMRARDTKWQATTAARSDLSCGAR
jgi:hypothetical protein